MGIPSNDLRRAIDGDKSALALLLVEQHDALETYIRARLPIWPCGFSVEDVLQASYVDATRGVCQLRTDSIEAFSVWLRRVAEHRLLDMIRRAKSLKRDVGRVEQLDAAIRSSAIDLIAALSADDVRPDAVAHLNEAVGRLLDMVDELPDDYRFAIQSHLLQEMSLDETAKEMNKTPEVVRHLVYRAKRMLRTKMGNTSIWYEK